MIGRLVALGALLAAMPFAVDLPDSGDASRPHPLTVDVAGGGGQFALVSRGCNGEVLRVTRSQLLSGALVVEQRFPGNFVVGVRAGSVRTNLHTPTDLEPGPPTYAPRESTLSRRYINPYVNPYVGYEGREVGAGFGWLMADQPFLYSGTSSGREHASGHLRVGDTTHRLTLRWMEDVPLESEGHFSADFGFHPSGSRLETGVFTGLAGPYDGFMLGARARVWFTPEAALQIKASLGGNGEHGIYGTLTARLPGTR